MEYGRRVRNVLFKYITSLGGTLQQNCLEMGGRIEKIRGYALHR
jgi:hypothetical protein